MVAEGIESGLPGIGWPLAVEVVERECYMERNVHTCAIQTKKYTFLL